MSKRGHPSLRETVAEAIERCETAIRLAHSKQEWSGLRLGVRVELHPDVAKVLLTGLNEDRQEHGERPITLRQLRVCGCPVVSIRSKSRRKTRWGLRLDIERMPA